MNAKDVMNDDELLQSVPGGFAKLVLDDQLTLLYATDTFYNLIKSATVKIDGLEVKSLRKVVYSTDIIYLTQQLAKQRQRNDGRLELHFRILKSNGSFQWIFITGNKLIEEYTMNSKQYPVYACVAMDATEHMEQYRKYEQELNYQHVISELSRDIYYVYEIATDTISFKEVFREVFGKESEITSFSKRLEKTDLIEPKERTIIVKIYKAIMNGKKQARFEINLNTKEGTTVRYTCFTSIIFDENKNPYRVIGKLSTNPVSRVIERIPAANPLDDQTKVYAKSMAESMIISALEAQPKQTLSALIIFEVRNYKVVNDVMKSLNGENVLTTIAGILKNRFRYSDVIGRLSNNEFIVFMSNMKDEQNAYDKAVEICDRVESLYSFEHIRNGLTISIGIQIAKGEGLDYQNLYHGAMGALALAKNEKKSTYVVFR